MMDYGPIEGISFLIVIVLLYLIPIILVIYWMVKMLKNSNENLKINREILERLKSNQND